MSDTIAAIATGSAPTAIGILRITGDRAFAITSQVFSPKGGFEDAPPRTLVLGTLRDRDGGVIDHALGVFFPAPHSYTGEDCAEIQCHGSPALLAMGLESLCSAGARLAGAGEFTRRAFLNGKLDLTRAEAVADLISAETPQGVHCAAGQLGGALCRRVEGVYEDLTHLLAHFHAVLDYPEEDLDPFTAQTLSQGLEGALAALRALLESYGRGRFLLEGLPCALVGTPNAGKSSLLNSLLGYERAIVTPLPGTTRDTVEERCHLGGRLLRLVDTAGLRAGGDQVERMGMERSRTALSQAELALVILDGSSPLTEEDWAVVEAGGNAPHCLCVITKGDLPPVWNPSCLEAQGFSWCGVSSLTGEGLSQLEEFVKRLLPPPGEEAGEILTNARQAEAATRACTALEEGLSALKAAMPADGIVFQVEDALGALGELLGRRVQEDVVDRIFSRFCVGK